MQPMQRPEPQNTRRRGPKLSIPLDADVSSVRYYKCPPRVTPKETKERAPNVPKVHLKYIPPALRRPSPWSAFLTDWLNSSPCEKAPSSGFEDDSKKGEGSEYAASCTSNSSSGACSGETVTTDFSSVSSPRKAPNARIDYVAVPPSQPLSQPSTPSLSYPFRVPPAASPAARLTPVQWAELARHVHQAPPAVVSKHPPPSLMSVHTAYLPELDATVRAMMSGAPPAAYARPLPQHIRPMPGQPWLQAISQYGPPRQPQQQPLTNSSSRGSAHGSESRNRSQQAGCAFCYQLSVHEAQSRGEHLPRLTDKGCWRGHEMQEGVTIVCPRLLRRVCSLCGATGQAAHPTNYCPITKSHNACY